MKRNTPTTESPPRAAIYSRYSTDMQQPISIERQVTACREYAERQGWGRVPDAAVYSDEAVSGSTTHRTAYQRLLAEIADSNGRPPYDVILIEDLSRLTRSMQEATRLVGMAPFWNIRLIGVNDGVDTARKGTKLLTYVKGAMAENFLDDLKDRIRGGLGERFRQGYHPGGSVYGFVTKVVLDPAGGKDRFGNPRVLGHRILVDPAQSEVVKRIFRDAASGLSPREIAVALIHEGVPKPCATYRFETPGGLARQQSPWNPGTVRRILRNERYVGRWTWNRATHLKNPETGKGQHREKPSAEILPQERPALALVDSATWSKVQTHIERRRQDTLRDEKGKLRGRAKGCAPSGTGYGNPWHGLLFCAECGGPFPIIISKPGNDGRPIRYLGCTRRHHMKERCGNAGICRLPLLDAALREALTDHFSDVKLATARLKRFYEALAQERRKATKDEAAAERERREAERQIEKVKRAILDGMTGPTTAGMLKDAEAKVQEAQATLEDLGRLREAKPAMVPPADVLATLRTEAFHDKRAAYRQLVGRVELRRRGREWEARITPNPEAGIQGVPKAVIASGRSASGRGGHGAGADD